MFGMDKKDTTETQENKKPSPWGSQLDEAVSDIRKAGVGAKERAKRIKSDSEEAGRGESVSAKDAERLAKMFQPEKWKPIVRAPFNVMKAKTGRACWELSEKETETLAETTSATAEHFLHVDPKWMILTLFVFNWSLIIADKSAQNTKERLAEEKLNPPKPILTTPIMVRS